MAQNAPIQFESVFVAPIVRAQFDVLHVLAEAIAPSLPDLYRAATNWNRVVVATAESFARQIHKVLTVEDAAAIWGRSCSTWTYKGSHLRQRLW